MMLDFGSSLLTCTRQKLLLDEKTTSEVNRYFSSKYETGKKAMLTEGEKKELKKQIQSNKHEVYVISIEEMDAIIRSSPKGNTPKVQQAWQTIKSKIEAGASYYASADDVVTMTKLVGDLGGFGARAYIKTYGGKPHIILKGHPGLRSILTGTKYGIKNPKIISMGLGKAGAIAAAKQGGILTVILLSVYRVADYFLTDEATIAGATTLAVGPILAVVVVGFGVAYLLEQVDKNLGITDRVIAGLDELGSDTQGFIELKKQQAKETVNKAVNNIVEYAIESAKDVVINWFRGKINDYLSPLPRVR